MRYVRGTAVLLSALAVGVAGRPGLSRAQPIGPLPSGPVQVGPGAGPAVPGLPDLAGVPSNGGFHPGLPGFPGFSGPLPGLPGVPAGGPLLPGLPGLPPGGPLLPGLEPGVPPLPPPDGEPFPHHAVVGHREIGCYHVCPEYYSPYLVRPVINPSLAGHLVRKALTQLCIPLDLPKIDKDPDAEKEKEKEQEKDNGKNNEKEKEKVNEKENESNKEPVRDK
jgi:hypothetical protein